MRCFSVSAVQKLHGNEGLPVLIVNFINGADVRMVQCRGSFRFALKAGEGLRVSRNVVGQKLERYEAVEFHILGLVNHTHAATAQLLDDAVVRDGLADHLGRSVS